MGLTRAAALAVTFVAVLGAAAVAQDQPLRSPLVTLDQQRLFEDSAAGKALIDAIESDTAALAAENRRIETSLIAEERDLTDQRASLPPEQFRALADAFDEKVVAIRRAQDAKARDLAQRLETNQQAFFRKALPLVAEIVREHGAFAVIDRGAVILAAEQIDITDEAIALIDERMAPEVEAAPVSGAGPAADAGPAPGSVVTPSAAGE